MMVEFVCLLLLIALCCAAEAEEPMLGMGRRHYFGEGRLDITYTTELATPHVDWADPYAGGPVSAFVVPSVMEGRTLVELMQRLSMKVDAVTIDPAWDVNKWTMSFGDAYGARSEQAADGSIDYSLVYTYLQEDLASDRRWDVMVMHGILGWGHLPETVRQAIVARVREGMGLVLVGPYPGPGGDDLSSLSPLVPIDGDGGTPARPQGPEASRGAWERVGAHFVTDGVPLETVPGAHLGHRRCAAGGGAQILVTSGGDPIAAEWQVGEGRVIAFAYENHGLAPFVGWDVYGEVGDAWWETWYSLMIRAILWAAHKESGERIASLALTPDSVPVAGEATLRATARVGGSAGDGREVLWQVRDDSGRILSQGSVPVSGGQAQLTVPTGQLDGGRHLVDVFLTAAGKRIDWATAPLSVEPKARVVAVQAPEVIEEREQATVTATLDRKLPDGLSPAVELVDGYQRVIARGDDVRLSPDGRTVTARLATDDLLTHIGWVRVSLRGSGRTHHIGQTRVALATPAARRVWDDWEVNVPFYGPHNYYHWIPLADEQYRRAGVTWLMQPERNFRFTVLAQPGGTGVYYYDRKPFEEQMAAYWETGDRKHLERQPCLHGKWREEARGVISGKIAPYLKYRPFHYYIADEPSLTSYTRAFDFCYSAETLAAFRTWLRREYRTLKALNDVWGSDYGRWSQIDPPTTEEAQRSGRIPAWADFRRFMDRTFADAMTFTQQVVDEIDPGALTLVGGTQMPTPFNGTDWWLLSRTFGILEPYSGIDKFRSFNPDLPIIQACGYQDAGPELEEELWRRALQGQRGATIFWNYTLHDPDLVLNSQGEAMERAFGALRGDGIAKLLLGAARDDCRIALLYSQMSLYAAWIQDGDIRSGRSQAAERWVGMNDAWTRALTRLGLQYRAVSYEQLARGVVDRKAFDVLVLPHVLSLSDSEIEAIRSFAAQGGLIVADGEPGAFDDHCRARSARPLAGLGGLHTISPADGDLDTFTEAAASWLGPLLRDAGVKAAAEVAGAQPEVVHYADGDADYVAIIGAPNDSHRVAFGRRAHVYDIRGHRCLGEADAVDAPAGGGVRLYALLPSDVRGLKVTAPSAVEPGGAVAYRVSADADTAFRHVFAVRIYAPDGALRHMYGANVEAKRGNGAGRFRLAWNDAPGAWRIVASDAATGATGEASFTVR